MADPFAGFTDQGPPAPAPQQADPFKGFEDRGPAEGEPQRDISRLRAAGEGYMDVAGFGLRDEIRAASKASGLPEWMGGFRAPVGAVRLGYEHLTAKEGEPKPVQKEYEAELAKTREFQKQAHEQQSASYLAGQITGGVVGPGFGAGTGATVGARALRSALAGGAQGALYGAGSGEGVQNRLIKGATGGAIGAAGGAILSPVVDIGAAGVSKVPEVAKSIYNTVRTEFKPSSTENVINTEAARRVAEAHIADRETRGGPALTPEEIDIANQANIPRSVVDLGGERTQALARSAADQSPEGRAALTELSSERYAGQSRRASDFIKGLVGGKATAETKADLTAQARRENSPAYARAYAAGAGEIASPELARLAEAPPVQQAMKEVATTGKTRAIADGLPAPNANVKNMQFWDYTYRSVRDAADQLISSGKTREGNALASVADQMRTELDRLVPQYKQAREGAAAFFGAKDALEAGQKFVHLRGDNSDFARQISKMTPSEKQLFSQGFASELSDRILELRDSQNVITQAFLDSPASKQRIAMALGPQGAAKLETYLRVEGLVDRLRQSLGNSKTNRFLIERGLAGGGIAEGASAGWDYLKEGDISAGKIATAALLIGGAYGKHRQGLIDEGIAKRIGEMLASDDPALLRKGINIVSNSPKLLDALRGAWGPINSVINRGAAARTVGTQGADVAP